MAFVIRLRDRRLGFVMKGHESFIGPFESSREVDAFIAENNEYYNKLGFNLKFYPEDLISLICPECKHDKTQKEGFRPYCEICDKEEV